MRGVECGPDRHPVDPAALCFWPDEGVWAYSCRAAQFTVRGGPDGPEPARFDLAQRVARVIDAFLAEANAYLAAFVVPERFKAFGPWELQGADFGCRAAGAVDEFELLLFLGDDIYGEWGVRFGYAGDPLNRFYPRQFWRRQQ
jgi:hypothetical protein